MNPYESEPFLNKADSDNRHFSISDCIRSVLILVGATLLGHLFHMAGLGDSNIIMVYILGVLFTAVCTSGRGYSIVSSFVSVLVFNFFFTAPKYTFSAYGSGYPVTFLIMFLAAFLTSSLAVKIKRQAVSSAETANRTKTLLETNQLLQQQKDASGIINVTAKQLIKLLDSTILFYRTDDNGSCILNAPLIFPAGSDTLESAGTHYMTEVEQSAVLFTLKNNQFSGASTDTFGTADCLYLTVRGTEDIYGVVGIAIKTKHLDSFETRLMLSILGECGLALEKDLFSRKKEEAFAKVKNEQLRADLLRSISHDLRTPLTSISGNAGVLITNSQHLTEERKQSLYTDIYDDSMWLISLVENLLAVTRIENGTLNLRTQPELLEEVLTEALHHIHRKSVEHHIVVHQSDEFLLVNMDARLIVQVLINLIDNAIKYTPDGSHIWITTRKKSNLAWIEVKDDGPGISDDAKEKVFDMFYTANNAVADSRRSLGLGLSLCKSIITAHGGTITVTDNQPKGTIFCFTLPAKETDLHE